MTTPSRSPSYHASLMTELYLFCIVDDAPLDAVWKMR